MTHVRGIASNLNDRLQQISAKAEREAFDLQYVTCVSMIENVLDSQTCKVVIASLPGLETSYAQILLKKWGSREDNLLLFVCSPPPDTLGYEILHNPENNDFAYTVRQRICFYVESTEDPADRRSSG